MRQKKIIFFLLISLVFIISSYKFFGSTLINPIGIPKVSENHSFLEISAIVENKTGNCTGRIYSLYGTENTTIEGFNNPSNYTKMFPVNSALSYFDHNLTAAKVELTVTAMTEEFHTLNIANDTSNAINATDQNNCYMLAQNFSIDDHSHIDHIYIYLNYTNTWPFIWAGIVHIYIYPNDLSGPINDVPMLIFLEDSGVDVWNASWHSVRFNNILPKGNYFLVIYTQSTSVWLHPNNNSWQIQNYTNPDYDKGASLTRNSSGDWNPIPDDGHADFLLMMNKSTYVAPETVDLTCYIEEEQIHLNHYYDANPGFLKFPWTSLGAYYIPVFPTEDINVTITVNQNLGWGAVFTTIRYIKFLPANGNFTTSLESRKWTVNYTSINSSSILIPVFVYPRDWTVTKFYDRFGEEVIEYGTMYSKVYNKTYSGIYYPETGDGYSTYEYLAKFTSPNYVRSINPQLFTGSGFQTQYNFYEKETIRLQAIIQDTENKHVTSGNCSFYLYDSKNQPIYSENITVANGIANSDNFTNLKEGNYLIIAVWANGTEVGFNSFTFSIQKKIILFPPPSPPEPVWLYVLTTIAIVLAALIAGLIVRRKVQEHHWEKSLLHLFIMNKDGRAMYDYPFGIEQKDPTLISGMLTALTSFVKETVGSKKQLRIIDQEDKKVILGHGKYCTVALFAEKDLPIIRDKVTEFAKSFEKIHGFKVERWDGSTTAFKGVNKLVDKYFPISAEDKLIQGVGQELIELKARIVSTSEPQEVLGLLRLITELAERYKEIIRDHYNTEYGELLEIANEKIKSSS